ncbi:phenylacetic acid degradation protein [Rhodococcoides trifolii]|uniref:Phenylacetic acid degradation protein n=1 Tax=Rhodococcoides trifolii TaxID=908250 RepID=A0A917G391_9NOCA|nr:PaaI family thioesterase [Rhodococcus trifolii]GGG19738.1 phenylacetic acid degradation protein [Rhodococcus trifolii]
MTTTPDTRSRTVTWTDPMTTAQAAAGRTGLEFVQGLASGEIPAPPIMALTGAELTEASEGRAVFTLLPGEYHYNPIGSVHGGIIATLLDSAAGCAVQTKLAAGVGYTSLDLSVKYLRGIRADTGVVTCTGTVVHIGRRTALAQAELRDATGRLLASATSSCVVL